MGPRAVRLTPLAVIVLVALVAVLCFASWQDGHRRGAVERSLRQLSTGAGATSKCTQSDPQACPKQAPCPATGAAASVAGAAAAKEVRARLGCTAAGAAGRMAAPSSSPPGHQPTDRPTPTPPDRQSMASPGPWCRACPGQLAAAMVT
jgi:hypothetical protein